MNRPSTVVKLFKRTAAYLDLIEEILPIASKHEYKFVSDESFKSWAESDHASLEVAHSLYISEMLDKAHLVSVTALYRAKRWSEAVYLMYETENLPGWAASTRGLLESAGDTFDGLAPVPKLLALNYELFSGALYGTMLLANVEAMHEFEKALDHFVHAGWTRSKDSVLKAKENVNYVQILEPAIQNVKNLYHRLCAICHPSNGSVGYLYEPAPGGPLRLLPTRTQDSAAIAAICGEYPDFLEAALMAHCNLPFLTLRVLHKFGLHPQLKALKAFDWSQIKAWSEVERLLRN